MAGFAVNLFVLLDALGAELFLLCFAVGARMHVRTLIERFRKYMERLDPYFFVPSRYQVVDCPAISMHTIPGYISLYLFVVCFPSISVDA